MKIINDSAIYLFGEIFSKLIPFLLLPYLTRKLGLEGYGELANIQAYIVLALVFIGLSQDGAITRYYYFHGKKSIGLVITSGMILSLMLAFLLVVFSVWVENLIFLYISLASLSQTFLKVQLSLRQCQKRPLDYTAIQMFSGLSTVIVTVLLFEYVEAKFEYRVLAIILANFSAFLIGFYLYRKNEKLKLSFSWKIRKKGFLYILTFGFPLIFHQLSFFMKGQLDRILIYEYFTPSELGVYAAGFQLAGIFSVLLMAVNKATVPYLYEGLKKGTINYLIILRWFKLSFLVVAIPGLCAYLIPDFIYQLILGGQFAGAKYYSVVFLFGLGLNVPYLLLVNFLFYHGKNKYIAYSTMSSSVLYVSFIYIFLNMGLKWVPYALFISNLILVLILYAVSRKIAKEQGDKLVFQ